MAEHYYYSIASGSSGNCGLYMADGTAILIDLFNPEAIVIGSIYARAGEYMKAGMEAVIEKEALPGNVKACRILPAGLGEKIGDIAALSVAMHTK